MNFVETDDLVGWIRENDPAFFIHGCNTCNIMGAGVAVVLADEWTKVLEVDAEYRSNAVKFLDSAVESNELRDNAIGTPVPFLLGSASWARVRRRTRVVNMYTQNRPGDAMIPGALEVGLVRMLLNLQSKSDAALRIAKIVMPRIGCGIGTPHGVSKISWWQNHVYPIVERVFVGAGISDNVTIIGLPGDNEFYGDTKTENDGSIPNDNEMSEVRSSTTDNETSADNHSQDQ